MLLRVVDYVGNPGGGVRFIVEAVTALAHLSDAPRIEMVSDGRAFATYESMFRDKCPNVTMRRVRPPNNPRTLMDWWYDKFPGMTIAQLLVRVILRGGDWYSLLRFDVPEEVTHGADAVWLPWIHGHRVMGDHRRVVATYHDTISIDFPGVLPRWMHGRVKELETAWCKSAARITVTSNATAQSLERIYQVPRSHFRVIRLSAIHHQGDCRAIPAAMEGPWQSSPYLLCPANTSLHKNHEVLLSGYARWGASMPLVLTGSGTDFLLRSRSTPRARQLRSLVRKLKLDQNRIIGLGYISDDRYFAILKNCHALVMPTLAEGGGSFPVAEAVQARIPVICSDIPVMREAMDVYGGSPLWFDPDDPQALAIALEDLDKNYTTWQQVAQSCETVSSRSWADVARDYLPLFQQVSLAAAI